MLEVQPEPDSVKLMELLLITGAGKVVPTGETSEVLLEVGTALVSTVGAKVALTGLLAELSPRDAPATNWVLVAVIVVNMVVRETVVVA